MKLMLASLAAAGLMLSIPVASAQDVGAFNPDQSFLGVDTDRNGLVSWGEFELAFADISEEQFRLADQDGDGFLNEMEFETLVVGTAGISTGGAFITPVDPGMPQSLVEATGE